MTVVDIRNVRGERNIEIFHTDKSHIYYSEELYELMISAVDRAGNVSFFCIKRINNEKNEKI